MGFLKKKKLEETNKELAEVKAEINKEQEVPQIAQAEAPEIEEKPKEQKKAKEIEYYDPEENDEESEEVKEEIEEPKEEPIEEPEQLESKEEPIEEPEQLEPELTEEMVRKSLINHEQRLQQLELSFQRLKLI